MDYSSDPRLAVLKHISVPIWVFDTDNLKIVWANSNALEFWNAQTESELYERELAKDISSSVRKHLVQTKIDCLVTGKSVTENWTLYPEGKPQNGEAVMSPIEFPDGGSALLIHIVYERKDETSDTLRSAQALVHTSVLISLYDEDNSLLYANPAARSVAVSTNETLNQKIRHKSDLRNVLVMLNMVGSCDTEIEVNTINGPVWHSMNLQHSRDPVTGKKAILLSSIDVSDRRKAQQEAFNLAYTDSLTGLPNRIALLEHLNHNCIDGTTEFGLLFLDLDRFKLINDSLGHLIGDRLLNEVGKRLTKILEKSGGLVARLGGDEFVVVVEDLCTRECLSDLASNILQVLGNDFCVDGHNISILPSIGICLAPVDGDNATTLMQHADVAMYSAKATKAGFSFFEAEMNLHAEKRLEIEHDLLKAIKEQQFELYYQPKISAKNYSITGMEALIRWVHPTKGIISPVDFIPVAEETGLITQIGEWVIKAAMEQQKTWQLMGHRIVVAVNVSPVQFSNAGLVDYINLCADETGCDPELIEFEITESLLLGDHSLVTDILAALSTQGFRLALDDFGTGYSNLAYLGNYPLTCLKIDRQFVMDIKQTAILEMVIRMGKMLGLSVVAEGVETVEQINWLKENDCDELQGFYFSRPMSKNQATKYITHYDDASHSINQHLENQCAKAA